MITVQFVLAQGFKLLGDNLGAAHYRNGLKEIRHVVSNNTWWLTDGNSSFTIIRELIDEEDVLILIKDRVLDDGQRMKNSSLCRDMLIRKAVLWAEIKAHEQEYQRIQKRKDDLDQAQKDISVLVQKKIAKGQEIAEKLLAIETKALIEAGI